MLDTGATIIPEKRFVNIRSGENHLLCGLFLWIGRFVERFAVFLRDFDHAAEEWIRQPAGS